MERLGKAVSEIAYTHDHAKLPAFHRSLVPFLSFASSLYRVALWIRRYLYSCGFFETHRLPVRVISVGNLTWGGNGKTPMVEYIARHLVAYGVSPLILTRGYAGGDESKMLKRHLQGGFAKIGIGANRAATAACFFRKYGYRNLSDKACLRKSLQHVKVGSHVSSGEINAVILDDGMQHWSLCRDLEIVMINGLRPWGNCNLLPLGPLREPLMALRRADIAVLHHVGLASKHELEEIALTIREINKSILIFYARMVPKHFFDVRDIGTDISLGAVCKNIVLCVSSLGSAEAFVREIEKMGAFYVDRIDFSDHHHLQGKDILFIRTRLEELEDRYGLKSVVVTTEKDYDRDPHILKLLDPFGVLVLCSQLEVKPYAGTNEEGFQSLLQDLFGI